MTLSLHAITEAQNLTGGATCLGRGSALAQRHLNNISGRESLPLVRFSADFLPRATSQALRFNSARLGLYHLNARCQFRWQAFADMARFRFHQLRLSNSGSSVALNNGRNGSQKNGKAGQKGRC